MTPAQAVEPADNQPVAAGPDDPRNHNLPRQLKEAILEAIKRAQREEKWMRRQEVLRDAKHRLYDMNVQHFVLHGDNWMAAVAGASYTSQGGQQEQFSEYIEPYNIFTAELTIQRAKLTESEPGIDFQPCDPKKPEDMEAAKAAEAMKIDYTRNNNMKDQYQSFIYHLQMGGRVAGWTRTVEGTYAPSRRGMNTRSSTTTMYGCLESKIPLMANDLKKFPYLILYEDLYICNAEEDHPWMKGIGPGPCLAEGEYERVARLQVLRGAAGSEQQLQVGDATSELVTEGNCWLRLSMFKKDDKPFADDDGNTETIKDEDGERPKTVKDKLAEMYPDGCHAVAIGQQYSESWNESMDDRTAVDNAYIGKGQSKMPIAAPLVVIQDRFNNGMNKTAEYEDYGDGSTWFFGGKPEFDAIVKQRSQPGSFRHGGEILANGQKAQDMMFQEKSLEVPKTVTENNQFLFGALMQFIMSTPPAVWGQQMPDQQTKGGYELASAQATGILGVFWMKMVWFFATIYKNNCLAIMDDADYDDEISVTVKGKTTIVQKQALTKGNFRAHPDTESGFPESTTAQRQSMERLATLLGPTPLAMQFFGSPDNVAEIKRLYGLPELTLDEAEARDKQLGEIEELLSESPTLNPELVQMLASGADIPTMLKAIDQAMAGMAQQFEIEKATAMAQAQLGQLAPPPPPPDPSTIAESSVRVIKPNYHVFEARKCQDWLSSSECDQELKIGRPQPGQTDPTPNVAGVLNVILHWSEHMMEAAKVPQPPNGPLPQPVPSGAPPAGAPPAPGAQLPVGM